MIYTTKYLICIDPQHPELGLRMGTRKEFKSITERNKLVPKDQKRKFIHDCIYEYNHLDEIYMEASLERYREWKKEEKRHLRCIEGIDQYEHLSLDALLEAISKDESIVIKERLSTDGEIGSAYEEDEDESILIQDLKAWEPWAYDLYWLYSTGRKKLCNAYLMSKYDCSERTAQRIKDRFRKHIFCLLKQYKLQSEFKESERA